MASPQLVPFRAEHSLVLQGRDGDHYDTVETALDREKSGPAYTALWDGKILGCAGIGLQWPGVGVAWAVLTDELVTKWPVWTTRNVRNAFRDIMNAYNLHRVEAVVLVDSVRNQKWIEMLGFDREGGVAHHYTAARQDCYRYEWVRYKLRIRPLREEDEMEFRALMTQCDRKWLDAPLNWFLHSTVTLVAEEHGRLVGYTIHDYWFPPQGKTAVGRNIGVVPSQRGKGLARKLHMARLRRAQEDGAEFFIGTVHSTHNTLAKLFTQFGAVETIHHNGDTLYVGKLGE